jgi:cobyrinic acid a,c-diamide synthase
MRQEIRDFSLRNMPVFAECGGFMYLCRAITTLDGKTHEMAGVYPAKAVMQKRLSSLGYREVTLKRDCPLGGAGDKLFGHEFHYSTAGFSGPSEKTFLLEDGREEGYLMGNSIAGYIHMHLGRTQKAAARFVEKCRGAEAWRS